MSELDTTTATPGDQLLARVINLVGLVGVLAVLIIGGLAAYGVTIPDVLENVAVASVTGLVALLAGRSRA